MPTKPRADSTTAVHTALQRTVQQLVEARPQRRTEIREAVRLLLDRPTAVPDGVQFADGVIVRRPAGACSHPPCQARITCGHEIAFQLAQDIPALVKPKLEPYPCRHCGQGFTDREARQCHVLAVHLRPEQADQVRRLFLRSRYYAALAAHATEAQAQAQTRKRSA